VEMRGEKTSITLLHQAHITRMAVNPQH